MQTLPNWIEPADQGMPDPEVIYYDDGSVQAVRYKDATGALHRKNGPAFIFWNTDGTKLTEEWWQKYMLHREDGPAKTSWDTNGQKSVTRWAINNENHRTDGPAVQAWHDNGMPASEVWCTKGRQHRVGGASYTRWNEDGSVTLREYYVDGVEVAARETS